MAIASPDMLFEEISDYFVSRMTPEAIIAFKPSEALDECLHELLDKNSEGTLTSEERAELERVMHLPPHPPAPSPTQCGRPSFAGGRGAITRAMSLSPFTWERDGLPKRSDASRVRGNLDIKVHNTL